MRRTDTSGSRRSVLALGLRALLVLAVIGGVTVVAPGRSEALATVTVHRYPR